MSMTTTVLPEMQDAVPPDPAPSSAEPPSFSFILQRLVVKVGLPLLAAVLTLWNAMLVILMVALMPANDFGRTFLSAVAFVHGQDMYAANASTPWWINDTYLSLWNLNPPHFHALLLPLAWLPNNIALVVWLVFNGYCFYVALRVVVAEVQLKWTPLLCRCAVVGLLAFVGTGTALVTGHLSFLLFLLLTLAWRDARHGRWVRSAVPLALALSVKPFLLFVVPYYLWRRQGRAVVVLGATVAACYLAGLLIFGIANNRSWLERLAVADSWAWLPMNASLMGLLTRSFTPNVWSAHFGPLSPAAIKTIWLMLGIPLGLLSFAAAAPDRSPRGVDRAFGLLLVGSLLLSPLGWTYYFLLFLGPLVALAVSWRRQGALSAARWTWREKLLLASLPGLCVPVFFLELGQPSALASLFFASCYCWSLLLIWLALVIDGWCAFRASRSQSSTACGNPNR
jgi:Glycosyltransferase family 87